MKDAQRDEMNVSLSVPVNMPMKSALVKIARMRQMSMSSLVRQALLDYIESSEQYREIYHNFVLLSLNKKMQE